MKLHLGCGNRYVQGFVNVDMNPDVMPDVIHDLAVYPWPFEDSSADEIMCVHVLEHLIPQGDADAFFKFFRECWRVMKNGGKLSVVVPDARGPRAFCDPSHKSAFNKDIFAFISKHSIAENVRNGTMMTSTSIDFNFDLGILNVVNDDIHVGAVAMK